MQKATVCSTSLSFFAWIVRTYIPQFYLHLTGDRTLFISRLPAIFGEHQRLIQEEVQSQSWNDYGMLAITAPTRNRPGTHYRGYETTANLYEQTYRAIVVHSSAHDRRRQKRLEREVDREHRTLSKRLAELPKTLYFCSADAQAALAKFLRESPQYHEIEHDFSFLKDPVLINAVFLKKPEGIEALGLILVISLLLWRLIVLSMRSHLEKNETTLPG